MIGVSFALPAESKEFLRLLEEKRKEAGTIRGRIGGVEVAVLHTGVGGGIAAARLRTFLANEKPVALVSSGFCGGTGNELAPGDLVIAEDASAPNLAEMARKILRGAHPGKIYSADHVVDPAADRYAIGREHGAIGVDMETATIAQVCREQAVPLLVLRVISDSPAVPFPAPPHVLFHIEAQRTKFSGLFVYLARHPAAIVRLMRFSGQVALARAKIADAIAALIPALPH